MLLQKKVLLTIPILYFALTRKLITVPLAATTKRKRMASIGSLMAPVYLRARIVPVQLKTRVRYQITFCPLVCLLNLMALLLSLSLSLRTRLTTMFRLPVATTKCLALVLTLSVGRLVLLAITAPFAAKNVFTGRAKRQSQLRPPNS